MIIYKTTNLINNKIYIGQDKHNNTDYLGSGKILKKAIKKYGIKNFKKEILEICKSQEELNRREEYWIKNFNSFCPNGYNIAKGSFGGDVLTNHPNRKNIIEKRAKKMRGRISPLKGRHITEEAKNNISKNNAKYWLGKNIPEYVKEKIRKSRKKQDMSYLYASYEIYKKDKLININCLTKFLKDYNFPKTMFYRLLRNEIKKYKDFNNLRKVKK